MSDGRYGQKVGNMRKTALMVSLAVAAVALSAASVAYACTSVPANSSTTITAIQHNTSPSSLGTSAAAPGDVITATGFATTFGANQSYTLNFLNYQSQQDGMSTCMGGATKGGADVVIGGPTNADASGNIPATTGVIPPAGPSSSTSTPVQGPALVCFITPGYGVATNSASLNIVL